MNEENGRLKEKEKKRVERETKRKKNGNERDGRWGSVCDDCE